MLNLDDLKANLRRRIAVAPRQSLFNLKSTGKHQKRLHTESVQSSEGHVKRSVNVQKSHQIFPSSSVSDSVTSTILSQVELRVNEEKFSSHGDRLRTFFPTMETEEMDDVSAIHPPKEETIPPCVQLLRSEELSDGESSSSDENILSDTDMEIVRRHNTWVQSQQQLSHSQSSLHSPLYPSSHPNSQNTPLELSSMNPGAVHYDADTIAPYLKTVKTSTAPPCSLVEWENEDEEDEAMLGEMSRSQSFSTQYSAYLGTVQSHRGSSALDPISSAAAASVTDMIRPISTTRAELKPVKRKPLVGLNPKARDKLDVIKRMTSFDTVKAGAVVFSTKKTVSQTKTTKDMKTRQSNTESLVVSSKMDGTVAASYEHVRNTTQGGSQPPSANELSQQALLDAFSAVPERLNQ